MSDTPSIDDLSPEFSRALQRVIHDAKLDDGAGADLVGVGVSRYDCLTFLYEALDGESEPITPEFLAVIVQYSVAIGVWLERARWEDQ